jgi:hypothetical protein
MRTILPPSSHDIPRLDVTVKETCLVDGRQCTADVAPDANGLARPQGPLVFEEIFQSAPADELHPHADQPLMAIRSKDSHDIATMNFGQQTSLMNHLRGHLGLGYLAAQELESHLTIKLCITSSIDISKRAFPDLLYDFKVPPAAQ